MARPHVFVGSSKEALPIAQAVQAELTDYADTTIWSQNVFAPGNSTLEDLCHQLTKFQFAILILTNDDMVTSRRRRYPSARANVVFELGLFIAALGRNRAVVLTNNEHLPNDLAGITTVPFVTDHPSGLRAALGPPCTTIRTHFQRRIVDARRQRDA